MKKVNWLMLIGVIVFLLLALVGISYAAKFAKKTKEKAVNPNLTPILSANQAAIALMIAGGPVGNTNKEFSNEDFSNEFA